MSRRITARDAEEMEARRREARLASKREARERAQHEREREAFYSGEAPDKWKIAKRNRERSEPEPEEKHPKSGPVKINPDVYQKSGKLEKKKKKPKPPDWIIECQGGAPSLGKRR